MTYTDCRSAAAGSRPGWPAFFTCSAYSPQHSPSSSFHGRLNIAGGLIAVALMVVVTLLVYDILKPVNNSLSLLAAFFNLVASPLRLSDCSLGA
jgi:hypothetical protein